MSNDLAVQLFSAFQLLSTGWGDFLGGSTPAPQTRPFFENFLEDQNQVHGGRREIAFSATQAYPADSDGPATFEPGPKQPPISFTQAYPSDSDQDGGGPITFEPGPKQPPISFTMAYPSDSDLDL